MRKFKKLGLIAFLLLSLPLIALVGVDCYFTDEKVDSLIKDNLFKAGMDAKNHQCQFSVFTGLTCRQMKIYQRGQLLLDLPEIHFKYRLYLLPLLQLQIDKVTLISPSLSLRSIDGKLDLPYGKATKTVTEDVPNDPLQDGIDDVFRILAKCQSGFWIPFRIDINELGILNASVSYTEYHSSSKGLSFELAGLNFTNSLLLDHRSFGARLGVFFDQGMLKYSDSVNGQKFETGLQGGLYLSAKDFLDLDLSLDLVLLQTSYNGKKTSWDGSSKANLSSKWIVDPRKKIISIDQLNLNLFDVVQASLMASIRQKERHFYSGKINHTLLLKAELLQSQLGLFFKNLQTRGTFQISKSSLEADLQVKGSSVELVSPVQVELLSNIEKFSIKESYANLEDLTFNLSSKFSLDTSYRKPLSIDIIQDLDLSYDLFCKKLSINSSPKQQELVLIENFENRFLAAKKKWQQGYGSNPS